jgi:hypothetical protein
VIVETCAEAFGVADVALELGHEARVRARQFLMVGGSCSVRLRGGLAGGHLLRVIQDGLVDLPGHPQPVQKLSVAETLCGAGYGWDRRRPPGRSFTMSALDRVCSGSMRRGSKPGRPCSCPS